MVYPCLLLISSCEVEAELAAWRQWEQQQRHPECRCRAAEGDWGRRWLRTVGMRSRLSAKPAQGGAELWAPARGIRGYHTVRTKGPRAWELQHTKGHSKSRRVLTLRIWKLQHYLLLSVMTKIQNLGPNTRQHWLLPATRSHLQGEAGYQSTGNQSPKLQAFDLSIRNLEFWLPGTGTVSL